MPQRRLQIVTKRCAACAVVLLFGTLSAQAGDLLVRVQGKQSDAPLYLGLVAADQPDWEPLLRTQQGNGEQLIVKDVPPGRFALQLYQDSNGNGRLDLSPRGIPLEPVGFSSNPTLLKGKPAPEAAQFGHGEDDTLIDIRLHSPRGKPQAN
ncbi:uncharacterized protein (DUF2141 family) [Pseudomonas sp. AG1028]|uniref:Uncharacterized conserved protein, DUF2141 family n=1 Tax=Pseudomonas straminea TaxID=47882 RepID=A0A1I1RXI5_PSEOC|nr:uncharacterized protein (DUF2141 family) [Pseudomonas sp. AG1028]SFD35370.1 Uncharacterized conserved protein, DUF2141 family [Pseudomonas straminea]